MAAEINHHQKFDDDTLALNKYGAIRVNQLADEDDPYIGMMASTEANLKNHPYYPYNENKGDQVGMYLRDNLYNRPISFTMATNWSANIDYSADSCAWLHANRLDIQPIWYNTDYHDEDADYTFGRVTMYGGNPESESDYTMPTYYMVGFRSHNGTGGLYRHDGLNAEVRWTDQGTLDLRPSCGQRTHIETTNLLVERGETGNNLLSTSNTGLFYSLQNTDNNVINSTDATSFSAGGYDSTSSYFRSYAAYKRTTTSSANVHMTSTGVFNFVSSSSARYKYDVNYLTNIEHASEAGLAKQPEAKLTTLDTEIGTKPDEPELHVRDMDDADKDMKSILDLPVVQFRYNDGYITDPTYDPEGWETGFIAEDVAEIVPEAVDFKTEINPEDEGEIFTDIPEAWNANKLVPRMLYVIQEQEKRITELENKLA